jgi:ribonuclease Z
MINVQFLGTSGSVPTEKRGLPSVYLEFRGRRMLFDCGEGTQRQMRIAGIPFMKLDQIFITHFHADHCLGLGGLIQTMDLFKRRKKLQIFGPEGIHDVIQKVISTGHFILEGFDLEVNEITASKLTQIYATKDFAIKCIAVKHSVPCLAYSFEETAQRRFNRDEALKLGVPEGPLFGELKAGKSVKVGKRSIKPSQVLGPKEKGRKVAYVTDTRPCKQIMDISKDAELLIHESTFSGEEKDSALNGMHCTASNAAENANEAGAKKLALYHISQRYPDASVLLKESQKIFKNTVLPEDLDKIEV